MDLNQFIQLLKRNIILLIAIPLLLAGVVYYFTKNQPKQYESETIIYTGITTGYSIESTSQRPTDYFSVNAQFDNLLNLLKSRQTVVETSIRLLAQDLCLEKPIPQYISENNYNALQNLVPKYIKDMVVKNNKSGVEREREEAIRKLQKEIKSLEREISKKKNKFYSGNVQQQSSSNVTTGVSKSYTTADKSSNAEYLYHVVENGESLSQIASRYGVSIGALIDINGLSNPQTITPGQSLIVKRIESTPTKNIYHTVKRGETLYSIAKKYGVNISKLRELNNLNNRSLIPGQKILISKESYTGVNSFSGNHKEVLSDNYTTPDTPSQSEILASDLQKEKALETSATLNDISAEIIEKDYFVSDPIVPPGVKKSDYEKTVKNLRKYYAANDTNFIYGLLHYGEHKHYSIRAISEIQIYRINSSDLVKLVYTSDDPGICMQTLKILSQVFMKNYKLLRENETDLVVKYFEEQVRLADQKLQEAEDRLLKFNKKNNIINYYEQSKAIAGKKEDLEVYYQNEQIRMSSSAAALDELETHLTARDSLYLKSDEINQIKKELAEVTTKILSNEPAEAYDERISSSINKLKAKQKKLRDKLKVYVDQLYLYSHSTQGVPISRLLDSWLKNTIGYVEAKASLVVLARRKMDFVRTYQKYAPLGATLKRIEREIKVAEQSYLELLRSLNLAKMKQQNLEMATNIKIVDPPFFPISAKSSKAKYLIPAALILGFLLILFIILVLEYFDNSMKNPSKVIKETGLKLAGAYPILGDFNSSDFRLFTKRLIDIIIQNLKMNLAESEKEPKIILLMSTADETGKTLISKKLVNRLREMGESVLFLNYTHNEDFDKIDEDYNYSITYKINDNFIDYKNLRDFIKQKALRKLNKKYDFIFVEIPSIVYNTYPIPFLAEVDFAFYIVKATDKFTKSDKLALETFREVCPVEPQIILNMVEVYALSDILSKVPKKERKSVVITKIREVMTYPAKVKIIVKNEK
jgi:LysM repeat protein/uncharacterized protein involved in exopolysaccharide biosynthesis